MWLSPFVRTESGDNEKCGTHKQVSTHHVQPNVHGQGRHEREEARGRARGHLEENADAKIHKRFGKVDHILAGEAYGERSYGQVSSL